MGKNKKTKGGDSQHSPSTCFVTNLPYSFTNAQLEETFSEVGPIRRCFIVTKKGSTEHHGIAYVQFAAVEDANRAVELKNGSAVGGRKIGVKPAMHRAPLEQRRLKENQVNKDEKTHDKESNDDSSIEAVKPQPASNFPQPGKSAIESKGVVPARTAPTEVKKPQPAAKLPQPGKSAIESKGAVPSRTTPTEVKKPQLASKLSQPGKSAIESKEVVPVRTAPTEVKKPQPASKLPRPGKSAIESKEVVPARTAPTEVKKPQPASKLSRPGKSAIESKGTVPAKTAPTEVKSSDKQRVAKTVIFGGLLNADMAEEVHRIAREFGTVCSVTYPLPVQELQHYGLAHDGCRPDASSVLYTSVKSARACVAKLHQKQICGGIVWARQQGGEGSKTQKWKLIIRNLPFKAKISEIKDMFSAVGCVWDVFIPQNTETRMAKGFAFVKFTSKQDAASAIQKLNGKSFGKRPIAVDWAVPKKLYTSGGNYVASSEDELSEDEDDSSDIEDGDVEVAGKSSQARELDVASDESDLLEEKLDNEVDFDDEVDVSRKILENLISSSSKEELASPSDHGSLPDGSKDAERISSASKSSATTLPDGVTSDSADKSKQIKPKETEEDLHKTVFISNLPFDIEKEEVKQRFSAFGELQSYFPVLHPVTKRPKGTGFLKFKTEAAADAAFKAANTDTGLGVLLKGRQVKVLKALDKQAAQKKEVEKTKKEDLDHRNLYLAKEGLILEGTAAGEGVSESDMTKRKSLQDKKTTKLQSPNFHVSRTRLIMYNLPKSMSDKGLKKLLIDAVVSRASKQKPTIKQIKFLKDLKKGSDIKKDYSRGVAFIEFTEHEHALVALRVLNNNPETFGPERRPIVEFALDNVQKLKLRDEKNQYQLQDGHNRAREPREAQTNHNDNNPRKRKLPGDRSSSMSEIKRKDDMGNKVSTGADNRGDERANKMQKTVPTSKGSRFTPKETPLALKKEMKSSAQPTSAKREMPKEAENINKRKKGKKNSDPLGRDVTDNLDILIERYKSKFTQNTGNQTEVAAQGAKKLKRWFQS